MVTGLVFIHHAPSALLSHVEWTLSGVSAIPTQIKWMRIENSSFGVSEFSGADDSGSVLASAFMNLKQLIFEVIQYPSNQEAGHRWCFTPNLGMFHADTDAVGNLLIVENQIRSAMERAGQNALKLQAELRKLLGQAWDDELEQFRERGLVVGAESNHGVVSAESERVAYGQNVRPL